MGRENSGYWREIGKTQALTSQKQVEIPTEYLSAYLEGFREGHQEQIRQTSRRNKLRQLSLQRRMPALRRIPLEVEANLEFLKIPFCISYDIAYLRYFLRNENYIGIA